MKRILIIFAAFAILCSNAYAQKTQNHVIGFYNLENLFDVYNDYEGINNIKTINDYACILLILVEPELIGFLKDCVYYQELTSGRVNLAMESVLSLWHEIWSKALEDSFSTCLLAFC